MSTTSIGPVELLVVKFPGNQFKGEIAPALKALVDNGTIRILDMLFALKDEEGDFAIVEVRELDNKELEVFMPLIGEESDLLSEGDVEELAGMLENNSSAAILLFENTWATRFRDFLSNANAELIFNVRIPQAVI